LFEYLAVLEFDKHCSGDVFLLHLLPNIIVYGIGQSAPSGYEHQNDERNDTNSFYQHGFLFLWFLHRPAAVYVPTFA
jgi:hypothetical protein